MDLTIAMQVLKVTVSSASSLEQGMGGALTVIWARYRVYVNDWLQV